MAAIGSGCAAGPSRTPSQAVEVPTTIAAAGSTLGEPFQVDRRWAAYSQYLEKMITRVQKQWERLLAKGKDYPKPGTQVEIVFVLNAQGHVARIVGVKGDAGEEANWAAIAAVTDYAPYGKWTKEMVANLGQEQQMTFKFYYQ